MEPTIVRVCNEAEREILAPHVERWMNAARILNNAAKAFEGRMDSEGLVFDPDRYAWLKVTVPTLPEHQGDNPSEVS